MSLVRSGQEGHDLAGGAFVAGFWQREVWVAVAAAVFVLHDVAGLGHAGDGAVSAAVGDARAGRDVEQHARFAGDAQRHPGVAG
jgi:hypothetical protein